MLPEIAVKRTKPTDTPVASPSLPPALLTVAVAGLEDVHVTEAVRSAVELSEKVPVAVYCRV